MVRAAEDTGAELRARLARLAGADPFEVLGVAPTASGIEVRIAYLAATKAYHPSRFAREPDLRDAASELFLTIRKAYEQIQDEERREAWQHRVLGGRVPAPAAAPPPSTGPRRRTQTLPTGMPVTGHSGWRPPVGPSRFVNDAIGVTNGARVPHATPPTNARQATLPSPATVAAARRTPPSGATAIGGAPPLPPPPARGHDAARKLAGASNEPVDSAPDSPLVSTGMTQPPWRPSTAPSVLPLEYEKIIAQQFEEARALLRAGSHRAAREAFHRIAAEEPQNRNYRAHMHLAWGLEHRADGRHEEAARELQRALGLRPELTEAAEALRTLPRRRRFLAKLFGR